MSKSILNSSLEREPRTGVSVEVGCRRHLMRLCTATSRAALAAAMHHKARPKRRLRETCPLGAGSGEHSQPFTSPVKGF